MMRIDIIAVVPEILEGPLNQSIVQRARDKGIVEIAVHTLRDYSDNNYKSVDDYAYGGGAGMVIKGWEQGVQGMKVGGKRTIEVPASLGIRVSMVRLAAFTGTSVVVGAVVSVCGMIGFVGLIVPHLLRLILGPDNRLLYPASFLGGAAFLVLADFLARNLLYPRVIPVGVFTAFCGGPFFLYLLRRYHRRRVF